MGLALLEEYDFFVLMSLSKREKQRIDQEACMFEKNGSEPRLTFSWHMLVRNTSMLVCKVAVAEPVSWPHL